MHCRVSWPEVRLVPPNFISYFSWYAKRPQCPGTIPKRWLMWNLGSVPGCHILLWYQDMTSWHQTRIWCPGTVPGNTIRTALGCHIYHLLRGFPRHEVLVLSFPSSYFHATEPIYDMMVYNITVSVSYRTEHRFHVFETYQDLSGMGKHDTLMVCLVCYPMCDEYPSFRTKTESVSTSHAKWPCESPPCAVLTTNASAHICTSAARCNLQPNQSIYSDKGTVMNCCSTTATHLLHSFQ